MTKVIFLKGYQFTLYHNSVIFEIQIVDKNGGNYFITQKTEKTGFSDYLPKYVIDYAFNLLGKDIFFY